MSLIIRLFKIMIPSFYGQADSLLLSFPSFSILSLPAPSQSWALILISNEMIALRFWFFLSPPSPQQLSWKQQCVCVWVCVFQSIPKAEQFITQTKPTGKRVLCCVCVLLPSVLSTHLYLHTSQPFHIFPLCAKECVSLVPWSAPVPPVLLWDGCLEVAWTTATTLNTLM